MPAATVQRREQAVVLTLACVAVIVTATSWSLAAGREDATLLSNVPIPYAVPDEISRKLVAGADSTSVSLNGRVIYTGDTDRLLTDGVSLTAPTVGTHELIIENGPAIYRTEIRAIPGALSILPPLTAILVALLFKQVVLALLAGVWLGASFLTGYQPVMALFRIIDHYVIQTLAGPEEGADHISIIVFTLLLGGMVGITSRMGGMLGIVGKLSRLATNARRGQFAVWLMGVIIFFDDYTNTLIVGNSMRPLTDRLRISREKLSYIVDSTAAPITALAVITSWIGFEISLLSQAFHAIGVDRNPLATFAASLPYSFYPILAILFVLFVVLTGRDYSLMLGAERRARRTGRVSSDTARPLSNIDSERISPLGDARPRMANGLIPIVVVIAVTFIGLIYTGRSVLGGSGVSGAGLLDAIKESDSFKALLWGSFSGCIAAAVLALSQRLLSLTETVASWINGIRSMLHAIIILVLAWCIGSVCIELHTADYLVHSLSGVLSPRFLPLVVFLLAMGISFSTGTSWGTMSILIPIVIPLVYGTAQAAGIGAAGFEPILLSSIAAILSGAVFGDHCSPISDTTIMSSMASAADHIDHVRTQLPYALTVGIVSLTLGYLLTAFRVPVAASLILSCAVLLGILHLAGRRVES